MLDKTIDLPRAHLPEPDLLSRLFDTVGTHGDVFCRTEASGPWGIAFGATRCHFHYVERGSLVAKCDGVTCHADEGALLILPQGVGHSIASDEAQPCLPIGTLIKQRGEGEAGVLRLGPRSGPDTRVICGGFRFNEFGSLSLLRGLPPVLHLKAEHTAPLNWLDVTLRFLALEAQDPSLGSAKMISSLIELMFIQAVRQWVKQQPTAAGWVAAFAHPLVAKALSLMHGDISRHWTAETLARQVGTSRATLFQLFTQKVGCPPLRYLMDWRMATACRKLALTAEPLASIAASVGYDETAFSRAFAREVGISPSAYRRRNRPVEPD